MHDASHNAGSYSTTRRPPFHVEHRHRRHALLSARDLRHHAPRHCSTWNTCRQTVHPITHQKPPATTAGASSYLKANCSTWNITPDDTRYCPPGTSVSSRPKPLFHVEHPPPDRPSEHASGSAAHNGRCLFLHDQLAVLRRTSPHTARSLSGRDLRLLTLPSHCSTWNNRRQTVHPNTHQRAPATTAGASSSMTNPLFHVEHRPERHALLSARHLCRLAPRHCSTWNPRRRTVHLNTHQRAPATATGASSSLTNPLFHVEQPIRGTAPAGAGAKPAAAHSSQGRPADGRALPRRRR